MSTPTVTIRPRRDDDLPALGAALLGQQAASGYPHREPLPMSTDDFIVRPDEVAAWVAVLDGTPVGHVAVIAVPSPDALPEGDAQVTRLWMQGHHRPHDELREVGVYFTATAARGIGAGRALMEQALSWIREQGLAPCLDVVPFGDIADRYRRTGWREVGTSRPSWLSETAPDVIAMVQS